MDYYKCENCEKIFDEFEMNFKVAQEDKKTLCSSCRSKLAPPPIRNYQVISEELGHYRNCPVCIGTCVCP
jgi:DNA-directed RNA polymerase subunit RPC12/RpoP